MSFQVDIGDVRLLLPLQEENCAGAIERSRRGQPPSDLPPENADLNDAPAFFVVVIGGFSIGTAESRPNFGRSRASTETGGAGMSLSTYPCPACQCHINPLVPQSLCLLHD